jgi:phage replication O-like protein O
MSMPRLSYTQIPNLFLDKYLPLLSPKAVKVFLIICRKTIGWHKETDRITKTKLLELTGIKCNKALDRAIKELQGNNLIEVEKTGERRTAAFYYEIKFESQEVLLGLKPDKVDNLLGSAPDKDEVLLGLKPDTKEIQDLNKKDINKPPICPPLGDVCDSAFTLIKSIYPKRSGGLNWAGALKQFKARIKQGVQANDMVEGAKRYAKHCEATGKIGTEYVLMPQTFLGKDLRFNEAWEIPDGRAKNTNNGKREFEPRRTRSQIASDLIWDSCKGTIDEVFG